MHARYTLPHWFTVAVLLAVPLIFFWQMIVDGMEPPAPDVQAVRPLGEWAKAEREHSGQVPLWCPMIFSGMPSYGSFIHTPSSPFDLLRQLRVLVGVNRGVRYYLSIVVGSLALYVLLLMWGAGRLGSLAGTLVFAMTPYLLGLVAAGHSTKIHALFLAPVLFLAVELMLRYRSILAAAALAFAAALEVWANHPQISYYTFLLAGLYAIGVLVFETPEKWRRKGALYGVLLLLGAAVLAGALVMEPYASVLEYMPHSIRGSSGQGAGWEYATSWSYPPKEVLCFLFPSFYGLAGATYWGDLPFTQSTHYFGITAAVLAIAGFLSWRSRRRWLFVALAGLVLLIGFGKYLPVVYKPLYAALPFFNRFRVPSMIYSLLPLLLAPLVAHGVAAVGMSERGGKGWLLGAAAVGVALLIWLFAAPSVTSAIQSGGGFMRPAESAHLSADQVRALVLERASMLRSSVLQGLLLAGLALLAYGLGRSGKIPAPAAAASLLVLLVVDLWVTDRAFYQPEPRSRTESILVEDDIVRFLKSRPRPFRVAPLHAFTTNRYAAFGIESVGGYQPAKLRIYDDLLRSGLIYRPQVLGMLNARYLIGDRSLGQAGLRELYAGSDVLTGSAAVFENPAWMPRAWFVASVKQCSDWGEMRQRLGDPGFAPDSVAYVYPDDWDGRMEHLSRGKVSDLRVDSHGVAGRALVPGPELGFLVLSEVHYEPLWEAYIDGERTEIIRCNHVLRGILIPPGEHTFAVLATSKTRRMGQRVSRAAGALLVAGVVLGVWGNTRKRRASEGQRSDMGRARSKGRRR